MANAGHLAVLNDGLEAWNAWRGVHRDTRVDLSGADLSELDLLVPALKGLEEQGLGYSLRGASWSFIMVEVIGYNLDPLDLSFADLRRTKLDGANLRRARLAGSDLTGASLRGAQLGRSNLSWAKLYATDLTGANLRGADLTHTVIAHSEVDGADFGYCSVYGISVWDLVGKPIDETNLVVDPPLGPRMNVDSLVLAPTIHYLSRQEHPRELLETLTNRMVLLLGSFAAEEMTVLRKIAERIRTMGYLPVIFDFKRPSSMDTTGTVETLARLARFLIADLTNPSSVPHELATTVPFLRQTPVILLRQKGATGYSMAVDLEAYPWVHGVHEYKDDVDLVSTLPDLVRQALDQPGNGRER